PELLPAGRHHRPRRAQLRPAAARRRPPVPVPQSHEGRLGVPARQRAAAATQLRGHGERPRPDGPGADARPPRPAVPRSVPHGQAGRPAPARSATGGAPAAAHGGIGKSVTPEPAPAVPSAAAVFKAPAGDEEQFMDAEVYKGFKKMRKKLGKKILSGSMTVDEARAKLGRQFAQKAANMVA